MSKPNLKIGVGQSQERMLVAERSWKAMEQFEIQTRKI